MSCKEASPVTRSGLISTSDILGSGKKFTWVSRQCLPSKMVKNDFSVWAFVKQCIGKELSKITMPIVLNEPLSFLQRIAEYMEYSELLDEAVKESDPVKRMEYVCAFAVSSMSSNANRIGKPFNPLLGETYELHYNNFVFVAEQVSHHPPITAFHVESENYHLRATVQFKIRFWGKSIDVQPKGLVTLELFNYNETYTWQNVNLTLHNVLMGKIWMEQTGSLRITNHTLGIYSQLEFLPANWLGQGANRFAGELYAPASLNNTVIRSASSNSSSSVNTANPSKSNSHVLERVIFGNWCRGLFTVEPKIWNEREEVNGKGNPTEAVVNNPELTDTPEYGFELPLTGQCCLWRARPKPSDSSDYYSFTQYTIGLNELNSTVNPSADDVTTTDHSNHDFEVNTNGNMLNCVTSEIPSRKNSIYGKFLPPTDSRYRPDLRLFEMGKIDEAASEKLRLEEKQRHVRKLSNQRKNSGGGVFNWSLSTTNHKTTGRDSCPITSDSKERVSGATTTTTNSGSGGGVRTCNPFRRTVSTNSTVNSSLVTNNNLPKDVNSIVVGPIWFIESVNPFTKQEEWIFTGEYWKRDWRKCPDLY
uniref:Oxysterol-binding protein n=2 Tax=Trichobilharzia regenti TaxID=157069 RepID=A0AA85J002_TRIRE|nr:unnamed protein product [Trichobilharzia regenti]